MAEIVRDKTGRVLFTKQMREEGYTILAPNMLPVHFKLFAKAFQQAGYNVVPLTSSGREIVNEGLHDVHNDTCYPALLVIGQLINALKSGKYDLNKVALMITQTGGGCRASNYIHLLRKALKKETKDAAVLIVAQRVSTIRNAEQIIVLHEGKMAGIGTHDELLKTCSVYQEIYTSQTKEAKES